MSEQASKPPRGFKRFRAKAEQIAKDPQAVSGLLESAMAKAKKGGIERVRAELGDMIRMVRAYFRGDYTKMPWTAIITALAGILYFVNPLDLIPDFFVGPGLLDDVTVIAFCLRGMRRDLHDFLAWEKQGTAAQRQSL